MRDLADVSMNLQPKERASASPSVVGEREVVSLVFGLDCLIA